MIKFSIIISTFNSGNSLIETVQNCLNQDYENFEIIIKDSFSQDGSLDNLPLSSRIKILIKKDSGVYDGMNQALPLITGDYVLFINTGDLLYEKNTLTKVAAFIDGQKQSKNTIFYGNDFYRSRGIFDYNLNDLKPYSLLYRTICHQALAFPSSIFKKQFIYDTSFEYCADIDLYLKCFKNGYNLSYADIVISNYEGKGMSDSIIGRKKIIKEKRRLLKKYFNKKEIKHIKFRSFIRLDWVKNFVKTNSILSKCYDKISCKYYLKKRTK